MQTFNKLLTTYSQKLYQVETNKKSSTEWSEQKLSKKDSDMEKGGPGQYQCKYPQWIDFRTLSTASDRTHSSVETERSNCFNFNELTCLLNVFRFHVIAWLNSLIANWGNSTVSKETESAENGLLCVFLYPKLLLYQSELNMTWIMTSEKWLVTPNLNEISVLNSFPQRCGLM